MENKQTSVEFLLEKYKSQNTLLFPNDWQKAKEMEKKQIMNAFEDGQSELSLKDKEEYYNETFKN